MLPAITRFHEKILDHLIKRRKSEPELFFIPRQRNTKNRLDQGYWFIGENRYLNVSFWYGRDWKEKVHSIGFVVNIENKTECYIELSAQGNTELAPFLEEVARKEKGFKKDKNKNKWFKFYKSGEFLDHLDNFIDVFKPKVDALINLHHPLGLVMMNRDLFEKFGGQVISRRKNKSNLGKLIN